jgi:peptidoglycan/xylan/chitin deacetylase (PgdA/CDA1 family)
MLCERTAGGARASDRTTHFPMFSPFKLAADLVAPLSHRLLRGAASIFMLHRFADPDRGSAGHDPNVLRSDLAYLRRERYELVPLTDLLARLRNRDPRLGKTIAFTVDDGYADFASVGVRVFAEYDCPVTVFVVTGVADTGGWYWWDRLHEALARAERRDLEVELANERFIALLGTRALAGKAARELAQRLKRVSDAERRRVIADVERFLEVELPDRAPVQFAPMTWDEVRHCARQGVTLGPHTVNHPIMSQLDDEAARWEIEASWLRLREQTAAAVPIFCYPNGGIGDVSRREPANLRALGFDGAVTATVGYATAQLWHAGDESPYLLPRFGYNGNPALFKQIVTGVLRARLAVRRAFAGAGRG